MARAATSASDMAPEAWSSGLGPGDWGLGTGVVTWDEKMIYRYT